MVTDDESATETTMELSSADLGTEQPMEAYLDDQARGEGEAAEPEADPAAEAPAEPRPRPAKKRGRASVPSWDEIMFGGGKSD